MKRKWLSKEDYAKDKRQKEIANWARPIDNPWRHEFPQDDLDVITKPWKTYLVQAGDTFVIKVDDNVVDHHVFRAAKLLTQLTHQESLMTDSTRRALVRGKGVEFEATVQKAYFNKTRKNLYWSNEAPVKHVYFYGFICTPHIYEHYMDEGMRSAYGRLIVNVQGVAMTYYYRGPIDIRDENYLAAIGLTLIDTFEADMLDLYVRVKKESGPLLGPRGERHLRSNEDRIVSAVKAVYSEVERSKNTKPAIKFRRKYSIAFNWKNLIAETWKHFPERSKIKSIKLPKGTLYYKGSRLGIEQIYDNDQIRGADMVIMQAYNNYKWDKPLKVKSAYDMIANEDLTPEPYAPFSNFVDNGPNIVQEIPDFVPELPDWNDIGQSVSPNYNNVPVPPSPEWDRIEGLGGRYDPNESVPKQLTYHINENSDAEAGNYISKLDMSYIAIRDINAWNAWIHMMTTDDLILRIKSMKQADLNRLFSQHAKQINQFLRSLLKEGVQSPITAADADEIPLFTSWMDTYSDGFPLIYAMLELAPAMTSVTIKNLLIVAIFAFFKVNTYARKAPEAIHTVGSNNPHLMTAFKHANLRGFNHKSDRLFWVDVAKDMTIIRSLNINPTKILMARYANVNIMDQIQTNIVFHPYYYKYIYNNLYPMLINSENKPFHIFDQHKYELIMNDSAKVRVDYSSENIKLFATTFMAKGDLICYYFGDYVMDHDNNYRYRVDTNEHIVKLDAELDRKVCFQQVAFPDPILPFAHCLHYAPIYYNKPLYPLGGYGMYANDALAYHKRDNINVGIDFDLENNALLKYNNEYTFLEASQDIQPGFEILVEYGQSYWSTERMANLRIVEAYEKRKQDIALLRNPNRRVNITKQLKKVRSLARK